MQRLMISSGWLWKEPVTELLPGIVRSEGELLVETVRLTGRHEGGFLHNLLAPLHLQVHRGRHGEHLEAPLTLLSVVTQLVVYLTNILPLLPKAGEVVGQLFMQHRCLADKGLLVLSKCENVQGLFDLHELAVLHESLTCQDMKEGHLPRSQATEGEPPRLTDELVDVCMTRKGRRNP